MDLRLHDPNRAAEFLRRLGRFARLQHRHAARERHAEVTEHSLGLVFVDIHVFPLNARQRPVLELKQRPD